MAKISNALSTYLGEMVHEFEEGCKGLEHGTEEYMFMQVMRECFERAYERLDLMTNPRLESFDGVHAEPSPQCLELPVSALRHITDKAIRVGADTVLICDDGHSVQALARVYANDTAHQIYSAHTLQ